MNEEVGIFICQLPIYHWLRAPLGVLAPLPEFTAMIVQDQVEGKKKMFLGKLWQVLVVSTGKAMAPHSSTLAWKIPRMEEPGRLQSMGSLGVGHDWATSHSLFTFMHWRRKWQPTPVFLPGESQGRGSLMGCRLWGRTESDTSEVT